MKEIIKEVYYFTNKITRNAMYGSRFYVRILGRKRADKHTVTLYLRIKHDKEPGQIMYSTGLWCAKRQFNARKQTVSDADTNHQIQTEKLRILKLIYALKDKGREFGLETLKQHLNSNQMKASVTEVGTLAMQANRLYISQKTHQQATSLLSCLIEKMGIGNKPIDTIQTGELEQMLLEVKPTYKMGSFLRVAGLLRQVFEFAKRKGIIDNNPFDRIDTRMVFQGTKQKTEKCVPAYDEISRRIAGGGSIYDAFAMFQLQTGMAFCDVASLEKDMIKLVEGQLQIVKNRNKTNRQCLIPVTGDTAQLFFDNNGFSAVDYVSYNQHLKKHYGITTHYLRHARARELLNRGLPLEAVARILGHTSINMTLHYAPLKGRKLSGDEIKLALLKNT